ncbi:hypothetical protein GGE24_002441 [Bradyrhizobium centrosematis]|jgi:NitT/TauT family transport system substrate-binding protein|nr:hypothetical protein [Bradyrhizobium centrosematis]MCS3773129.1 hypothetical protein [Bradyrhizobium centrosematis]
MYLGGIVTNWLQQSTDFFMAKAGIKDFTLASKYFDPSLHSMPMT